MTHRPGPIFSLPCPTKYGPDGLYEVKVGPCRPLACLPLCLQEKFSCDIVRIIQYNAELTEESVAYTSHVASASARSLFTKVCNLSYVCFMGVR